MEGAALPGTLRERRDIVLSGDLVYRGLRKICKRRLWKRASLSTGASCGTWRGPRFPGNFERQMKEGSRNGESLSFSMGALRGGLGRRAPLPWTLKDM